MNKEIDFENAIKNILTYIGENINREGLLDTPKRVRKAFEFMCSGYNQDPKEIIQKALFTSTNDEMVVVKDIEFYSFCEHHMLPIIGKAHVAYIPNGKVVGLSKIPRVVDVFARRLQIQEQMTEQICEALNEHLRPKGVAVMIDARHMCMEMRGVEKICSTTVTSSLRGLFKSDKKTKDEFLSIVASSFHK
ncbi:GTP cyclohydrolase I FolE [Aliarcobacter butzleri]|uniref:GTP cyclohydrolase I FolE n=1 Tax=Aliarcobacter butzleri TaxID=28197 RepID=UPI001260A463|nr:GTP cyclohydrolase I FolE [Aliarcobacter butzleri]